MPDDDLHQTAEDEFSLRDELCALSRQTTLPTTAIDYVTDLVCTIFLEREITATNIRAYANQLTALLDENNK